MVKRAPISTARFSSGALSVRTLESSHQHAQRQDQLRRTAEEAENGEPVAEHRGHAPAERGEPCRPATSSASSSAAAGRRARPIRRKRDHRQRGGHGERRGRPNPPVHRQHARRRGDEEQPLIARGRQHGGQHAGRADPARSARRASAQSRHASAMDSRTCSVCSMPIRASVGSGVTTITAASRTRRLVGSIESRTMVSTRARTATPHTRFRTSGHQIACAPSFHSPASSTRPQRRR